MEVGGSAALHALMDPALPSMMLSAVSGGSAWLLAAAAAALLTVLKAAVSSRPLWCRSNSAAAANVLVALPSPSPWLLMADSARVVAVVLSPSAVRSVAVPAAEVLVALSAPDASSACVVPAQSPLSFLTLGLRRRCGGALGSSGGGESHTESLLNVPCARGGAAHTDSGRRPAYQKGTSPRPRGSAAAAC